MIYIFWELNLTTSQVILLEKRIEFLFFWCIKRLNPMWRTRDIWVLSSRPSGPIRQWIFFFFPALIKNHQPLADGQALVLNLNLIEWSYMINLVCVSILDKCIVGDTWESYGVSIHDKRLCVSMHEKCVAMIYVVCVSIHDICVFVFPYWINVIVGDTWESYVVSIHDKPRCVSMHEKPTYMTVVCVCVHTWELHT